MPFPASVFAKTKREFPDWNGYCVLDGVELRFILTGKSIGYYSILRVGVTIGIKFNG